MRTTMREAVRAWQGLGLALSDDPDYNDCPGDEANAIATALLAVGGRAPANVLLLALQRSGYDDAPDLILQAIADEPVNFAWYSVA